MDCATTGGDAPTGHPPGLPDTDDRVRRELFLLGGRGLASTLLSIPLLTALVTWTCRDLVAPRSLVLWAGLMGLALSAALVARRWLLRAASQPGNGAPAHTPVGLSILYAGIGACWGGIGLLFTPAAPVLNAVVLVIFLGVIAGGASNVGVHSVRDYLTMLAAGVLVMLPLLDEGFDHNANALRLGLLVYALVMVNASRNAHRTLVSALRLRIVNQNLVSEKAAEAERANRANREKSLFLAAASHDLRQPVHALLLLIEALRQRARDDGVRELADYMHQAGTTIGDLFSALMELSRLESGAERAQTEACALPALLDGVMERHRPEAQRLGLALSLRIGASAAGACAITDPVLLSRILDNLLSNALRYTPHGRVLVSLRASAGHWRIAVHDTGIGIPASEQEHIFEPYYQVANPERDRRKGLGLGMAIVRQTAQLLGHPLTVTSFPGRGSRFTVDLHQAQRAAQPTAPAVRVARAPQLAGCRILVIDDDPMVLHAMSVLFDTWGVDHRCVADEASARTLRGTPAWAPQVILCDFRLPGPRNGIAVLDGLQELWPDSAAILQTGELSPQARDAADRAGYLMLTKPVSPDRLAQALEALQVRG